MTREEAIEILQEEHDWCQELSYVLAALDLALAALRPISREKIEQIWHGCGICEVPTHWQEWGQQGYLYCPHCGKPLTEFSIGEQARRLEALKENGI